MGYWSDRYVGRPYIAGEYDCADLVCEVQEIVFGRTIALPQHAEGIRGQSEQIMDLAEDYACPTTSPQDGDGVLMRCRGLLAHIGVYTLIEGIAYCLHAQRNAGQVLRHRIIDLSRYQLEVEGYYRWR